MTGPMVIVIPVFLNETDRLWRDASGMELMRSFFKMAGDSLDLKDIFFFTNDPQALDVANRIGFHATFLDIKPEIPAASLFPSGTLECIRYLTSAPENISDDVMVLNFKNPLINPSLIRKAEEAYQISDHPVLLSVIKVMDHPCQLNRYYTIEDLGFIHFFDYQTSPAAYLKELNRFYHSKISAADSSRLLPNDLPSLAPGKIDSHKFNSSYFLSKSFRFNWKGKEISSKGSSGLYIRRAEDFRIRYVPMERTASLQSDGLPDCFWLYESDESARVLCTFQLPPDLFKNDFSFDKDHMVWGASFSKNYARLAALMLKGPDNRFLLFLPDGHVCSGTDVRLRMAPVSRNELSQPHTLDLYPLKQLNHFRLDSNDHDLSGIIYSILKTSVDNAYDLAEPFPPQDDLWKSIDGQVINMITGKPILGRQDFPAVFEPDGSIFIFKKNSLDSLKNMIIEGNTCGFVMDNENSIQLNSRLDFLKYQARLRAHRSMAVH
jgi:CMP-N-acetylneuraminic acid synthetase